MTATGYRCGQCGCAAFDLDGRDRCHVCRSPVKREGGGIVPSSLSLTIEADELRDENERLRADHSILASELRRIGWQIDQVLAAHGDDI